MSLMKVSFAIVSSLALAGQAQAAATCSVESFASLKQTLAANTKMGGAIALTPTVMYNGLTSSQINANSNGAEAFNERMYNRFGVAVKAFVESGGDANVAAMKFLGASNRRQLLEIYKHANANSPASVNADCSKNSCEDIAMELSGLHVIQGKSVQQVMDSLSGAKLSSISPAKVFYCETGAGCSGKAQMTVSNSKVRNEKVAPAMRLNTLYSVREIASVPFSGSIDNTSLFKVSSLDLCGHQAMLMSGIAIRDANSFMNSTQTVLAVEAGGKVLALAYAQGIAKQGSSAQNIFLGGLGSIVRKTVVGGYNAEADRLGTDEDVNSEGFLR